MCLLDQALTLQCLRLDPDIAVSQTRSEFGAFKPVSVLSFDNSLKPVLKLVTVWYYKNKQIVLNQFLFFIDIDPISTHFWCESYLWPYIDNVLRAGADPGFEVRGAHLKKLRRAEGGAKFVWVFRVKNHDLRQKILFFPILGVRP